MPTPGTATSSSLQRLVSGKQRSAVAPLGLGVRLQRAPRSLSLSLHPQVWELRERLSRVRGFWAGLPQAVCADSRMAADVSQEAAPCWTGSGRGR